jgi:hypothetical protein
MRVGLTEVRWEGETAVRQGGAMEYWVVCRVAWESWESEQKGQRRAREVRYQERPVVGEGRVVCSWEQRVSLRVSQ